MRSLAKPMMPFGGTLNRRETRFEWPLWFAVVGLMVFGAAFIFSATVNYEAARRLPWYNLTATRQIFAYAVGLVAAFGLCLIDYRILARWSLPAYWLALLMLVIVFLVGVDRNGARRWIDFGPIQFQPSEFAKLAFLFAMADFLARPAEELRSAKAFLKALAMALAPFVLILKQPDLGSALVFMPMALVMMLVGGVPVRHLTRFLAAAFLVVALVLLDVIWAPPGWRFIKLEDYQRRRLLVYFNRDFAARDATPAERKAAEHMQARDRYNVEQALISVGSGGIWGKGWRNGTQTSLGYLPRAGAHNDFLFSVLAEESGFFGSLVVLGLYATILFSGIKIAGEARDGLGRVLASGIVALLFTHLFVNIGMNVGLMPVTGIPLPLLSAGGTSVLCSLIAIGILQNIHLHRRHY